MGAQMGAEKTLKLKVVVDTNCAVSALVFESSGAAWLRSAWRKQALVPVVSKETVTELLRVLANPKFKLTKAEREAILADYLPYAEVFAFSGRRPAVPDCRDAYDKIFLQLLIASSANWLITGNVHLLSIKVKGREVMSLAAAKQVLGL